MSVIGQMLKSNLDVASNSAFGQRLFAGNAGDFSHRISENNAKMSMGYQGAAKTKKQLKEQQTRISDLEGNLVKAKEAGNVDDIAFNEASLKSAREMADNVLPERIARKEAEQVDAIKEYGNVAKDWITGADYKGEGRAGTIALRAGMVGGAMLAPRIMTGGNLTENGRGERDIAGIPFI